MAEIDSDLKVIEFSQDSFHWNEYIGKYHINIICSKGSAHFSSSDVFYQVGPSDYIAWSIDMEISEVWFSKDFEGRFLLTSSNFLIENNPQSLWTTKGYLLIKTSPVIHLSTEDFELLNRDMDDIERLEGKIIFIATYFVNHIASNSAIDGLHHVAYYIGLIIIQSFLVYKNNTYLGDWIFKYCPYSFKKFTSI